MNGPLTTEEIESANVKWIKKIQDQHCTGEKFQNDIKKLNLQKDTRGIYICKGRIQGEYPIYLPTYGGVGITMTKVRELYWVPRLRQLAKQIRRSCYGCKRFTALPLHVPPIGNLPTDRTTGERPYQVIGLGYGGPFGLQNQQAEAK